VQIDYALHFGTSPTVVMRTWLTWGVRQPVLASERCGVKWMLPLTYKTW
jgi:hypothetical protein